ncbi:hypothetical protein NKG94_51490 [Micromonospora sp. M12]
MPTTVTVPADLLSAGTTVAHRRRPRRHLHHRLRHLYYAYAVLLTRWPPPSAPPPPPSPARSPPRSSPAPSRRSPSDGGSTTTADALMTTGSITATALLVAWSQVHTIGQLYAVMIGVGITGAMVLYEPAFAVIVAWFTLTGAPLPCWSSRSWPGSPAPSSCP